MKSLWVRFILSEAQCLLLPLTLLTLIWCFFGSWVLLEAKSHETIKGSWGSWERLWKLPKIKERCKGEMFGAGRHFTEGPEKVATHDAQRGISMAVTKDKKFSCCQLLPVFQVSDSMFSVGLTYMCESNLVVDVFLCFQGGWGELMSIIIWI